MKSGEASGETVPSCAAPTCAVPRAGIFPKGPSCPPWKNGKGAELDRSVAGLHYTRRSMVLLICHSRIHAVAGVFYLLE